MAFSFYYLHKFGGSVKNGSSSIDSTTNQVWADTALGTLWAESDFGVSGDNPLDFIFNKEANPDDGFNTDGWEEFQLEYKNTVGSDVLSYLNGYCDTSTLALGDMKNIIEGGNDHYTNITTDFDDYAFLKTQDGDLYRFTDQDGFTGFSTDLDASTSRTLSELYTQYEAYKTYKDEGTTGYQDFGGFSLQEVGISETQLAAAGVTSAEDKEIFYQMVIDQMVDELEQLKSMTISEKNEVALMKELEEKQTALKAIDDSMFGYKENATSIDTNFFTYEFDPSDLSSAARSAGSTIMSSFGGTSNNSGNISTMLNSIANLVVENIEDVGAYGDPEDISSLQPVRIAVSNAIQDYVQALDLTSTELPSQLRLTSAQDIENSNNICYNNVMNELNINTSFADDFSAAMAVADKSGMEDALTDSGVSLNGADVSDVAQYFLVTGNLLPDYVTQLSTAMTNNSITLGNADRTATTVVSTPEPNITVRESDASYPAGSLKLTFNETVFKSEMQSRYDRGWFLATWGQSAQTATTIANDLMNGLQNRSDNNDANDVFNDFFTDNGDGTFTIEIKDISYFRDTVGYGYDLSKYIACDGGDDLAGATTPDSGWFEGEDSDYTFYGTPDRDTKSNMGNDVIDAAADAMIAASVVDNSVKTDFLLRKIKNQSDDNAIVNQLSEYLTSEINGTTGNQIPSTEVGNYLSEVSAALIENYWAENYNREDAPTIYEYFDVHFREYMNPEGLDNVEYPMYHSAYSPPDIIKLNFQMDDSAPEPTIVDYIMESMAFAQLNAKHEERMRLEMEIFELSTALDMSKNVYNQEYIARLAMLSEMEEQLVHNTSGPNLDLDFSAITGKVLEVGSPENNNPFWAEHFPWFKGFYGNMPDGATVEEMFDEEGNIKLQMLASGGGAVDPYVVDINGVDYIMGIDDNNSGTIDEAQEILGITDTKENLFASLLSLDNDNDGYISQQEMKDSNIIFDAVNKNHRLNNSSLDTEFVRGIDLSTIKEADGTDNIFGNFNVELKNGKKADAVQTFESQAYFNNLFGSYVDLSFVEEAQKIAETVTSETTEEAPLASETDKVVSNKIEQFTNQAKNIFAGSLKEDSDDVIEAEDTIPAEVTEEIVQEESKSDIENYKLVDNGEEITISKFIDEILWQEGIARLTSSQRYGILDSIDVSQPIDIIERRIREKISATQYSA